MRLRALAILATSLLPGAPAFAESASWLERAERSLARREYQASHNHVGLQAPNRAHALRTYFDASGIRIEDRTQSALLLAVSLARVGRGDVLAVLPPGEVASEGARIEIRRAGITEWYENSPAGLEQGFTFAERPAGAGALVLELALNGATASPSGDDLILATQAGRSLRYGKLVANDARGARLAAHLNVAASQRIRIVIDDEDAVYPLVIDPIFQSGSAPDTQFHGDQQFSDAGKSVAGAGDVNGDGYDDVIIGAPRYDAGQPLEGVAWIFLGSAAGIASGGAAEADAQLESNRASAQFGTSVAGAGDVNGDGYNDVIVSAPIGANPGSYVFHGGPSGIPSAAAADAATTLAAGASVAGAGDVNGDGYDDVIIGTPGANLGQANEGAALIFLGSSTGIANADYTAAATLIESNQVGARLGASVAGAGDINGDGYDDVIVGSPLGSWSQGSEGRAAVFLGSASGVASGTPATAHARIRSQQDGARLGSSVAGAGDVNGDGYDDVIIGAYQYDGVYVGEGLALIFLGSASGLTGGSQNSVPANPAAAATRLTSDLQLSELGVSVDGAGDVNNDGFDDVIVGAYGYGYQFGLQDLETGAAYVFLGSATGVASQPVTFAAASLQVNTLFSRFGYSVAGAGDVNGDGHDDVIVGAYADGTEGTAAGAAFVYLGNIRFGPPVVPGLTPVGLVILIALLAAIPFWARRREVFN